MDGWLWWSTTLATQMFGPQPHTFLSVRSHKGYAVPLKRTETCVALVSHLFEEAGMSVRKCPNEQTGAEA